eukprot:1161230-Pelagomonas_calceolata.AAC.12
MSGEQKGVSKRERSWQGAGRCAAALAWGGGHVGGKTRGVLCVTGQGQPEGHTSRAELGGMRRVHRRSEGGTKDELGGHVDEEGTAVGKVRRSRAGGQGG